MSRQLKLLLLAGTALLALWGFWFFQTERDYGVSSKPNVVEYQIPFVTVPEQVTFIRNLAAKSDDEFFDITDRINFPNYTRLIYFEYIQSLGAPPSRERVKRLEVIAGGADPDAAIHAKMTLLKISRQEEWPAKAAELLKSMDGLTPDGRVHVFNLLLSQMGENKVWLKDLRNHIYASKDNEAVALGLRHLASMKDSWVGENIAYFVKHQNADVRAAAVQSLSSFCSLKTESLLSDAAKNEKDPKVLVRIVDELLDFPRIEIRSAYAGIAAQVPNDAQIKSKIRENLAAIEAAQLKPACTSY